MDFNPDDLSISLDEEVLPPLEDEGVLPPWEDELNGDLPLDTGRPLDRTQAERRFGVEGIPSLETDGTPIEYVADPSGTSLVPRKNLENLSEPRRRPHPIDEYALGAQVKQMRASGMSYAEISKAIGIDPGSISEWCERYDRMPTAQKRVIASSNSVFDFAANLQYTHAELQDLISRLKQELDDARDADKPMNPAIAGILTSTLKAFMDAQAKTVTYMKTVKAIQDRDNYRKALLAVLETKSPGIQAQIMKEMQKFQTNYEMLGATIPEDDPA